MKRSKMSLRSFFGRKTGSSETPTIPETQDSTQKQESVEDASCPECGSQVVWDFTCHTWKNSSGSYMSCLPCDSAVEYSCTSEDCFWDYTDGLNPGNPRSITNEKKRPSWLENWDLGTGHYFPRIYPGVMDRWDWMEENEE